MEALLMDVNWPAVFVGTIAAFLVGWFWYSDKMFGVKWREGVGVSPDDTSSMKYAMIAQVVSTFLLAWIIAITAELNSLYMAILVAFTISIMIKANGLYSQKSHYAIKVESSYVIVMVIVMIIVHALI